MKYRKLASLFIACRTLAASAIAVAGPAEYAIRWDPSQGGPRTAAEALSRLTSGEFDEDVFEIRYAVLSKPRPDINAILRERIRTSKPRFELTYKLRSDAPLPKALKFSGDECPAGETTDPPKDEVDVSFTSPSAIRRAHSLSCTVESKKNSPPIPAALKAAQFAPCTSKTTRLKVGDLKVEEWRFPDGRVAIEVSRSGTDTAEDRELFRKEIVTPLVEAKIRPLKLSKTEMGSDCKAPA